MIVTCIVLDHVREERVTIQLDDDDFAKVIEVWRVGTFAKPWCAMSGDEIREIISITLAQDLPLDERIGTLQFAICAFVYRLIEKERITIEHLKVSRVPGLERVGIDFQATVSD